jgi:hypothetical protein
MNIHLLNICKIFVRSPKERGKKDIEVFYSETETSLTSPSHNPCFVQ